MRKADIGRWHVPSHDPDDEVLQIQRMVAEAVAMIAGRIGMQTLRPTLPSPVEGRHREPAPLKIGDRLEILLDEIGAAQQQDNGAAAAAMGNAESVAQA